MNFEQKGLENRELEVMKAPLVLDFNLKIQLTFKFKGDNYVEEVLEDVNAEDCFLIDKEEMEKLLSPLIRAGVNVDYDPWESDGESGTDWLGSIWIKKDSINSAILEGKLKFVYDRVSNELTIKTPLS